MLCPDCRRSAPGGQLCPQCGRQVPDQEGFSGEGGHYLVALSILSLFILSAFLLVAALGHGVRATLSGLYSKGWIWLYLALLLIPIGVGLYYWFMLREEEITVTDQQIARRSRWGNESMAWEDVRAFRCERVLWRQTRLGRVSWVSRFFKSHRRLRPPPLAYELEGTPTSDSEPPRMRLEPGTINDLPWLLELISEHVGPPSEG